MAKHDLDRLDARTGELRELLRDVAGDEGWDELILEWRRPGWTTPAEFFLVNDLVETMVLQARVLGAMKKTLLAGSALVGSAPG